MYTTMEHIASPTCRAVVIWIDWYSYHLARFKGLQAAFGTDGEVRGIELVGGMGVHQGYNFREGVPQDLPVETLLPKKSWHEADKVSLAFAVFRRLTAHDPEIVLVPGYYTLPAIVAALWCKVKGRTSVLMTESTAADHIRKGWRERFKSKLIRTLFDWAVTGGAAHDRYLIQLGFPKNRIVHFYDVVGNSLIQEGVANIRQHSVAETHGLPSSYFLFVGRLAEEKNAIGLLDAWLQYRAKGGTWPLVFAGDGPDRATLNARLSGTAYANEIHFFGHRSSRELLPIYAFASAFVLPSKREPWGLVVNEAMAAGLPVIVSNRCGAAEDLVAHGENGFVFDPSEPAALPELLMLMASASEEERDRMAQAAARRIARYTPQTFGDEIVAVANAARAKAPSIRRAADAELFDAVKPTRGQN